MTPLLIMTLALGGLSPQAAELPSTLRLEIDAAGLVGLEPEYVAQQTALYVREDGTTLLHDEHEVAVVEEGEVARIFVELSWVDQQKSIYGVVMKTQRVGEAVRELESFECECTDPSLSKAVQERLGKALSQLGEVEVEAVVAEPVGPLVVQEPVGEPVKDLDPATQRKDEPPKAAALGPLSVLGIVGAAGGLGMAGFGVARIVKGEVRGQTIDEQRGEEEDFGPSGRVWLGAGLGAVGLGVLAVVVDVTVLRKRRQKALTLVPLGGATQVGLSVRGRF